MNPTVGFGFLASAFGERNSDDGDTGNSFPRSDAEDLSCGARFIPGEVTLARRAGQKVKFVTECGPCCWYWEMPDRSRIYHFDPIVYQQIGMTNKREQVKSDFGTKFKDGAGPCPQCGNSRTNGGTITAADVQAQTKKSNKP